MNSRTTLDHAINDLIAVVQAVAPASLTLLLTVRSVLRKCGPQPGTGRTKLTNCV